MTQLLIEGQWQVAGRFERKCRKWARVQHQTTQRAALLVVGGEQRRPRGVQELGDHWYGYGAGVILGVDVDLGTDLDVDVENDGRSAERAPRVAVERHLRYVSPADVCGPEDPILFKSSTYRDGRLYACTQTEVLVLEVPGFAVLHHLSLPCFNDVHHVVPTAAGTLLVANSGLEMVLEVTLDGEVVAVHNVLGEDPWAAFPPDRDYRIGVDLKPHRAHPNHVLLLGDEPFATRFELRDAVSLHDPARVVAIERERAHDGVVHDGRLWFTTVDGHLVVADASTLEVVEDVSLAAHHGPDAVLGWCRGLLVEDEHVWVGFSRIRATRFRQTLSWVRTGTTRFCPTRIARYRRADWTCDLEVDLEPHGLNAVFSIIDLASETAAAPGAPGAPGAPDAPDARWAA